MELIKLTEENLHRVKDRQIWFVRYYADYLEEIYSKYPELPFPVGVIEPEKDKQGVHIFRGHEIEVKGTDALKTLSNDAVLIITTGYFQEEFDNLLKEDMTCAVKETIYYYANRDTEYYEGYLNKYADEPLKNIIVFRSGMGTQEHIAGMDFTENSRALFEYLVAKGFNDRYEMVWLVKFPENYREVAERFRNVRFVSYDWAVSDIPEERDCYYRVICQARFFFFTHGCGFCRLARPGQMRVQLWHGCGFKTVNNHTPFRKRYEYTTVISDLYADIHMAEFGLDSEQMLVTGYAKEDWLFHPASDWKARLNVAIASKYIFWLPTFRVAKDVVSYMNASNSKCGINLPLIESVTQLNKLNEILAERDTIVIVKMHPLQKEYDLAEFTFSNILFISNERLSLAGLHINEILGDADALLSDYSSAAVDYLLLDRPLGFVLDDLEEYRNKRGFVLNPIEDWLPGAKIKTFNDLLDFVEMVCDGQDEDLLLRRKITSKLHKYHDDSSCKRITEALNI